VYLRGCIHYLLNFRYDGNVAGTFISDAMPRLQGSFQAHGLFFSYPIGTGVFTPQTEAVFARAGVDNWSSENQGSFEFDSSLVFNRIANEVRVASLAVIIYITY